MRTIVKGETPASLVEAEKRGWDWDDFVENDRDGYQACREQANAEQQGVCAYTASAPAAESADEPEEKKPREESVAVVPDPVADEDADVVPDSEELIGQGISFLGGLMKTLKDPDASKRLVDALVKEDPATGKASINIPVSDKAAVLQFVSLLGKLLN